METKKKTNWFLKALNIFFIIFMILYIISKSGYINTYNLNNTLTTEEEINQFEQDVSNNKPITNSYIEVKNKNYANKFSDVGENISSLINKAGKKVINIFVEIFSILFK